MTATPRVLQETRVSDLHLQTVDLARQLNGAYGVPILATLVSACVQVRSGSPPASSRVQGVPGFVSLSLLPLGPRPPSSAR